MSNKKVVSTLAHLINTGISAITYYYSEDNLKHKNLKNAVAYWDGEILCFKIKDKLYRLKVLEDKDE